MPRLSFFVFLSVICLNPVLIISKALAIQSEDIRYESNVVQTYMQYLDEMGEFRITVSAALDGSHIRIDFNRHQTDGKYLYQMPSGAIANGLQAEINGKKFNFQLHDVRTSYEEFTEYLITSKPDSERTTIDLKFYGNSIGRYIFDSKAKQLLRVSNQKKLSAFDIRRFYALGKEHTKEWRSPAPAFSNGSSSISKVDLHTHFAGAMRAQTIVSAALAHKVMYPSEFLDEMGVRYERSGLIEISGKKYLPISGHFLDAQALKKLSNSLSISLNETITFEQMENLYRWRSPLVKEVALFETYLRELAKDYKAQGTSYVELSLSGVMKPEWLAIAHRVLPQVEAETGVKIRFMIGLWRHSSLEYNRQLVESIKKLGRDPYIVGVDFMGHETNSTNDFAETIKQVASYKQEFDPQFQIRVHAGENRNFPSNVKDAIRLGATRIGHGVYGVDQETLKLAREKNVIIEFNTNSNLALENISGRQDLPIREYLDAGVRLTLGSDGHGLYKTTPHSEIAVLTGAGVTTIDLNKIEASDLAYTKAMDIRFQKFLSSSQSRTKVPMMCSKIFSPK